MSMDHPVAKPGMPFSVSDCPMLRSWALDGDEFEGAVKIKVGPDSAQHNGAGGLIEKEPTNYRSVIAAEGKERAIAT